MIKKTKLFGIVFPTTILLPLSSLSTSCNKPKVNSDTSSNHSGNDNKTTISEEIKNFIKSGVLPKEDKDESVLVVKDLVSATDSRTKKSESEKIEESLNKLASRLDKTSDEDKVELTGNKIVEDALKAVIYEKCKTTSSLLKDEFGSEFSEVTREKILEIDGNGLFFNLKTFGIDKILHDIGYDNDSSVSKIAVANSEALKIYRFSTNLKLIVNTNGGKKAQVSINDLNLFVVSDKDQVLILKKGISDYLQEKFETETISLYLDGNEPGGKSDREINEHFTEILQKRNYNLVDNEKIRMQTMSYLANKYLPKLIYKKPSNSKKVTIQDIPIEIESSNPTFNLESDNFLKEGMNIPSSFKQRFNFLNFFGNQQKTRQINQTTIKEIKPEHFLKDSTVHDAKYYSLGSGTFSINQWNIRKFPLRPIDIKFEILINCDILEKEIRNLRIWLNNLLDIMSKSSVSRRYINKKFVLDINWSKSLSSSIASQLESEKTSRNTDLQKLNRYLTLAYINPTSEKSKGNFSSEIFKNMSFNFQVNTSEEKNSSSSSDKFNEKLEIYLVFNSSFKIKLSDEFLYNTLDEEVETKLARKDLSVLRAPVSTVVSNQVSVNAFKNALITTLQTGNFVDINLSDVDITKADGNELDDNYLNDSNVSIKISAKAASEKFTGQTEILSIKHSSLTWYTHSATKKDLVDLESPVSIVKSDDNNAAAFKNALITTLQTGNFVDINLSDVDIKAENGGVLNNEHIGINSSVTIQITAKAASEKFTGSKTLTIKRHSSKITTRFHIS